MYTQCLTANSACMYTTMPILGTPRVEDLFATTPMMAAGPIYQQPDEEEIYTLFEQAMSDRLIAVNRQLHLMSVPLVNTQPLRPSTDSLGHSNPVNYAVLPTSNMEVQHTLIKPSVFGNLWQRSIIFVCMALTLMLVGFDLMGLLILHLH